MPSSPKRYGMFVDRDDWPLRDSPTLPPTLSSVSPDESIEALVPSTTSDSSVLLPGFHFSTTDESVDPAEFHRIAAQLLSGESSKRDSAFSEYMFKPSTQKPLHDQQSQDLSRRFCCSCGRSFSTTFRLFEHAQQCVGSIKHPLSPCNRPAETREELPHQHRSHPPHRYHRSNNSMHEDSIIEPCPECGNMFPAHQLPEHLASGFGGCDGVIQGSTESMPAIDEAYRDSTRTPTSQQYWIYEGHLGWDRSENPTRDSMFDDDEERDDVVDRTMDHVKRLLRRPVSQSGREACDLCGELFSKEGDELALHVGAHSLDFSEKRHKCDGCQICFANERDLDRHLQSANLNDHCGFTFCHVGETCSGHHPPLYAKSSLPNNHDLMQRHLWGWERAQLRSHRVTVARLLAERLNQTASPHMSLQDAKRTYVSLLPHVRVAARQGGNRRQIHAPPSPPPPSGWINDCDDSKHSELDEHLSRLIAEMFQQEAEAEPRGGEEDEEEGRGEGEEEDERTGLLESIPETRATSSQLRPDSSVIASRHHLPPPELLGEGRALSLRKSLVELAKRGTAVVGTAWHHQLHHQQQQCLEQGHKRSRSGPMAFWKQQARSESWRPQSLPTNMAMSQSAPVVKLVA